MFAIQQINAFIIAILRRVSIYKTVGDQPCTMEGLLAAGEVNIPLFPPKTGGWQREMMENGDRSANPLMILICHQPIAQIIQDA